YNVSFYATPGEAQAGDPTAALPIPYLSATTTIYIRVEDAATGCVSVTSQELVVIPGPVAPVLDPLQECDANNDGFAGFDLTPALDIVSAGTGVVNVTVHETFEDATYGENIVPNTTGYTNIAQWTQTLYIRMESNQSDCYDIAELQLIVNPVPEAVTPEDYELCDNGQDDTDGQAIFDLGTVAEEVLGGLDPSLYSVSYYDDETNAENGVSPITTPGAYLSPTATVYIRVTENATGCYDVVALELIVNPLPVVNNPVPYSLCDEDNPGDEQEVFDLTTKID
ncbi:hypothetical protein ABS766_16735, partial [Flavobacterium sp. ST-119]